jgi:hypothetical protein
MADVWLIVSSSCLVSGQAGGAWSIRAPPKEEKSVPVSFPGA